MAPIKDFDADSYELDFEEDTPDEERKFYVKSFPNVNMVAERRLHCTSCNTHIGAAAASESVIRMHPILRVTHCKKCHTFYNSGEFSRGEDGSELYCRWCGQGGEVYCCAKCPFVFCKKCIVQNLSRGCVNDILNNDNWDCFACSPKGMWHLRATHWAHVNYIEKMKKKILSEDHDEEEIYELMNNDPTNCCRDKKHRSKRTKDNKKKRRRITSDSDSSRSATPEPKKRATSSSFEGSAILPTLITSVQQNKDSGNVTKKAAPISDITDSPDIVCTPDIMSMFSEPAETSPVKTAAAAASPVSKQATPASPIQPIILNNSQPPPLVIRHYTQPTVQPPIRRVIPLAPRLTTPTTRAPVYHTINGFRIDLNTAAQQETYRLPNGKLIQVKKQPSVPAPSNNTSNTTNTLNIQPVRTPVPSSTMVNVQSMRPPQSTVRPAQPSSYATIRYNMQPSSNQQQPTLLAHQQMQQIHLQQQQQLLNGIAPIGQISQHRPQLQHLSQSMQQPMHQQMQQQIQQQMQQPLQQQMHHIQHAVQQHGAGTQMTVVQHPNAATAAPKPTKFPNTPLGVAQTQLESQIFGAQEICQHIINKLSTLMISNPYKTVRNFNDVKELHIHLSYLLKYTIGRFNSLQDKCQEDMKKLGFAHDAVNSLADKRAKYNSDEDDLEIVEPTQTFIEIDSDDETPSTTAAAKSTEKATGNTSRTIMTPVVLRPIAATVTTQAVPTLVASTPAIIPPTLNVTSKSSAAPILVSLRKKSSAAPKVTAPAPPAVPLVIADESDDENEIPLPPPLEEETDIDITKIDIERDDKLNGKAQVIIEKVEDFIPMAREKLKELLLNNMGRANEECLTAVAGDKNTGKVSEKLINETDNSEDDNQLKDASTRKKDTTEENKTGEDTSTVDKEQEEESGDSNDDDVNLDNENVTNDCNIEEIDKSVSVANMNDVKEKSGDLNDDDVVNLDNANEINDRNIESIDKSVSNVNNVKENNDAKAAENKCKIVEVIDLDKEKPVENSIIEINDSVEETADKATEEHISLEDNKQENDVEMTDLTENIDKDATEPVTKRMENEKPADGESSLLDDISENDDDLLADANTLLEVPVLNDEDEQRLINELVLDDMVATDTIKEVNSQLASPVLQAESRHSPTSDPLLSACDSLSPYETVAGESSPIQSEAYASVSSENQSPVSRLLATTSHTAETKSPQASTSAFSSPLSPSPSPQLTTLKSPTPQLLTLKSPTPQSSSQESLSPEFPPPLSPSEIENAQQTSVTLPASTTNNDRFSPLNDFDDLENISSPDNFEEMNKNGTMHPPMSPYKSPLSLLDDIINRENGGSHGLDL